ncbi:MAG: cob(I)yrinic acid a,c-diamide adenosyltransferase [Odoribacteraceae bacterium]|jgi:cob(I)alamin adenosyltransferase|nr:cob(I)yrinic acid a,c-diamide adenosyltransferase [Odoribacteraceae bacterium]
MKIYTRTGDDGTTSLVGGARARKSSARLEAYGAVDELNAHVGMIRSYPVGKEVIDELVAIQRELFVVGANLATDLPADDPKRARCSPDAVAFLERAIDRMTENLPRATRFILPGGDPVVSACHVARAVCRRAERRVVALGEKERVDEEVARYANRLSDYLFVLSRRLTRERGMEEINWEP